MNIIIIILIILTISIFSLIYNNKLTENFDESKIKIAEFASDRIKEFNYDTYKIYIDKYFQPIKVIDLKSIPVLKNGLIFCSIASYRDRQCPPTVIDMIEKALHPENLVICICQQNDPIDVDCIESYVNEKKIKIKILRLLDKEARGPCWARYLIQQEWRGEEYFLQIDSHMRFVQDWDKKCLDDIEALPEKSCLTNYPSNFNLEVGTPDDNNQLRSGLFIVNKETSEFDGFFRVNSDFIAKLEKPSVARGWGACFSFSKSNLLHDAPYDPYTPFLFFGEEMDIWARMYTNGWYCYAPKLAICFTSFDRSYRPTFWENPDQIKSEYLSRLRLYWRFGYLDTIPKELQICNEHYNLGKQKTWEEFMSYCLDDIEPTISDDKIDIYHNSQNTEIKFLDF